ncbi:drug resistance transporter, EmrB/QacA family protein [Enterococcus sp. DIV0840]|uniref:DHA2 family efflux MFS transporter permease subunit n=1 Tax=unclassified Enterococcus TaxID=2608891 RepID=UPI001A8D3322|nr:DHA2 family efflux MFS transporter permease subunit [Enterococcus sp. DIV0849a]MBO0435795.1 DHA2 family efflux MFS transporter permease subunit [Enterococcus sp. DIV0849a]
MERKTNVKLVTISVFVATFMTAIEGTIVSTAMPTIVGSLHGMEIMNWVFSIYLLTNAMLTPIYGKLADKIGRKPIFMIGIIIFIIGSSLCGLAQNMITLIIARAIQGIGAGAIMPVALTILADIYSIDKRAKMLGLNSAAWGIASIFGPLAGGFIVDTVGWHWIFFINVPIGLVLMGLIAYFLVEPKREKSKVPMDILGSVQLMFVLLTLLLGFQLIGDGGFSLKVFLCLGASVLFFIGFVFVEKRAKDPVIDLMLFKNSTFVIVNIVAALISGFLMGVEVYIPMWMQGVLGKSAGIGGLVLAPMSILWMVGSFIASNLMEKHTTKRVLTIGLSITLLGGIFLVLVPATISFVWFFAISSVLGIGFGITITTTTVTAQSSVDPSEMGVATSFNTLARTIGQTLMVSIFGVIINAVTTSELAKSTLQVDPDVMNQLVNPHTANTIPADLLRPLRGMLYAGLHNVYLVGIGLIIVAIILNVSVKKKIAN